MREILFRGKRIGDGEWVEGNLFVWVDGDTDIFVRDPGDSGCQLKFSVWPDSVSQYTGLKDKNGKKVFEGDIVRYEDAEADFEGYHDNVFANQGIVHISPWGGVLFTSRQTVEMDDLYVSETSIDAEVIGNIHDNPELLGGADNG